MNIVCIVTRFPDQEACIEHLERVRWGEGPRCPHCHSERVVRKVDRARVGRWNCNASHISFNVLPGTIMEKTRILLQKWFLAIGLMVDANESLPNCQLVRDLELNQKSA